MKKTIPAFVLIVLLFHTTISHAQEKQMPPANERAAKLTEWMKTNLSLTTEQEPKVQEVNLKYAQKVDELKKSSAGRKQKMQTLKSNGKAKDAEFKSILNESQFQTYLAKKKEMQEKFKEKMKENQ